MMWLVVGLGNPGPEYARTRHNIGFQVIKTFAQKNSTSNWSHKFKGEFSKILIEKHEVLLLKPQTYMNLSGECVQPFLQYFKIPLTHLIVIHDELDLPFRTMKIQKNRGSGGHNGIKSIQQMLGTQDFIRIKMGVGKPIATEDRPIQDVASYVLSPFSKDETPYLKDWIETSCNALETLLLKGVDKAASVFNAQ